MAARVFRCTLISGILLAFVGTGLNASAVTFDTAAMKADTDTKLLRIGRLRARVEQFATTVYNENGTRSPQSFTFKFTGLPGEAYDVYINMQSSGSKTRAELEQGLDLTIPGSVGDPARALCLQQTKPRVQNALDRLPFNPTPEVQRVKWTLDKAKDWVGSGIRSEEGYRSVDVMLVPAGRKAQSMGLIQHDDAQAVNEALALACEHLQEARDRMYNAITDPYLRKTTVAGLTPIDLHAKYSVIKGKPSVEAKVVNYTDLPIRGKVNLALPKGWKATAKTFTFDKLAPGKTFTLTTGLVGPKKAKAPKDVPVTADVAITLRQWTARLALQPVKP